MCYTLHVEDKRSLTYGTQMFYYNQRKLLIHLMACDETHPRIGISPKHFSQSNYSQSPSETQHVSYALAVYVCVVDFPVPRCWHSIPAHYSPLESSISADTLTGTFQIHITFNHIIHRSTCVFARFDVITLDSRAVSSVDAAVGELWVVWNSIHVM